MNTLLSQDAATPPDDSTTRLIPLSQGKFAIVNAADFEWLNQWKWCVQIRKNTGTCYAARAFRNGNHRGMIYMHRIIMGAVPGEQIDHRDNNGINNTRCNMRFATQSQNNANRRIMGNSKNGMKGVKWFSKNKKWGALVSDNGKKTFLGHFGTKEEAHEAYTAAALRVFGEFAHA